MTARALRRSLDNSDNFPQDVVELMAYFETAEPNQRIRAVPGAGTDVPIWILGSSLFGAQLAAHLGSPYAFASHFAPGALNQALEVYRETYRPSERWPAPHFMLAINVFAADTDEEALLLKTSMQQAFVNLRTGRPGPLPRPMADFEAEVDPMAKAMVDQALAVSATGAPHTVRSQLSELIETHRPDEVMLTGQIHDHAAPQAFLRHRSGCDAQPDGDARGGGVRRHQSFARPTAVTAHGSGPPFVLVPGALVKRGTRSGSGNADLRAADGTGL